LKKQNSGNKNESLAEPTALLLAHCGDVWCYSDDYGVGEVIEK